MMPWSCRRDKLLVETAKIIQNCCDQNAIISRTGGDEFTILFPNTTSEEAYEVLKHIQHCCNDYNSYTFNDLSHQYFFRICGKRVS